VSESARMRARACVWLCECVAGWVGVRAWAWEVGVGVHLPYLQLDWIRYANSDLVVWELQVDEVSYTRLVLFG
jgi:hypothetical protein